MVRREQPSATRTEILNNTGCGYDICNQANNQGCHLFGQMVEEPVKKTIYIKLEVESETYEDAVAQVEEAFATIETVLENESVNEIPEVLKTRKIVNKLHM